MRVRMRAGLAFAFAFPFTFPFRAELHTWRVVGDEYGGPGEMGMGKGMRMRIRMRMRAFIAQTCSLLSDSAPPFHMLRSYPYDAGVLAF
eukprot:scaffold34536_cov63-Phaeocystis_antarctica.AAC.1